jgi:molybdenum cofactor cytidylyltransferase
MTAPTVLILASGRGERFTASGGATHKLDALLPARDGLPDKTVLNTTLDAVMATGLPYHVERDNHAGMGDAIAAAVAKTQSANGWLILPADMPLIDPVAIRAVADALSCAPDSDVDPVVAADNNITKNHSWIVAPYVRGKRGHPVAFPRCALHALLALTGDAGAKSLFLTFQTHPLHVDHLPSVLYPEGCLIDIDTVADMSQIKQMLDVVNKKNPA